MGVKQLQDARVVGRSLVWRIITDALENERALDVRFRELSPELYRSTSVPNYKVMKLTALKAKLGITYNFFIRILPIAVLLSTPLLWLGLVIAASARRRVRSSRKFCRIIGTSDQNINLIHNALDSDLELSGIQRIEIKLDVFSIGRELGLFRVILLIWDHLRVLIYVLTRPSRLRTDLLLHSRDALSIAGLAYLAKDSKDIFVTDDHYQRWAHVLSYFASDFRIVQHGFLDNRLSLPHQGGVVNCIYVFHLDFVGSFEIFYKVVRARIINCYGSFEELSLSEGSVFLASSFPHIDDEIKLVKLLKERNNLVRVIVKFHPVHQYDVRKNILSELTDFVYVGLDNPLCYVFVSYGSFMEFLYKQRGIETVSISRSGSVVDAVGEIIKALEANLKCKG